MNRIHRRKLGKILLLLRKRNRKANSITSIKKKWDGSLR